MAIKYRKNSEKNRDGLVMMLEATVFRVQCAFPNMETFAFLDEKQAYNRGKIRKK